MPTYTYQCQNCGEFELWQSIHADPIIEHDECGGTVCKVYGPVRTHGVGVHGAHTNEVEARENRWHKDMPAYKRFRDKGYMPPQIDGCDRLEATAQNYVEINTGGRVKVDIEKMKEAKTLADDIMSGRV